MTLFVRDVGQGEPVVLVHGLGASHRAFDELIALGGYRYLAVDLPGVGESGEWASNTPDFIARGLSTHLTAIGVKRYRLFGHSFGGLVALSLAAQQPTAIDALIVANAPGLGLSADAKALLTHPMFETTSQWLGRVSLPVPKAMVRGYLKWLWGDVRAVSDAAIEVSVVNSRNPRFMPAMLECLSSIAHYPLPLAALRDATFRKQVLWGDRDRLVSAIDGERLAIAIGATLRVLPGVGHSLPEEAPHELKAAIDGA